MHNAKGFRREIAAPAAAKVKIMSLNLFNARYVYETARCALVTCDGGQSYMLGYFLAPRHAWTYVATFDQMSAALRAFEALNCAADIWSPGTP